MNLIEALEFLKDIPDDYTLKDLSDLANSFSIMDNIAGNEEITHLYTKFKLVYNDNMRVLDHTEVAQLLTKDNVFQNAAFEIIQRENPAFTDVQINVEVANYLYGNNTNGKTGPWADASTRFVAKIEGDVVCHIGDIEGAKTRTWWNVEMEVVMNNTNITTINGVPKQQLWDIYNSGTEAGRLDIVCQLVSDIPADNQSTTFLDNAVLQFDSNSNIISVDTSAITGNTYIRPETAVFSASVSEINSYASDAVMSSKYSDFTSLSLLEQLQAKKGNDLYTKLGIDPARTSFSDPDLATHLALVGSDPDIISQSTIYFDSTGKIAAIDVSQTTGGSPLPSQGSYTASASVDEWSKLTKDSDIHKYDGFDSLSDLDKYYAKKGIDLYQKNGFDISDAAKSNQASLSSHLSDIGRTQSIADDITFHYSGDGNITGIDLPGTGASSVSDSAFSAKLGEMKNYVDDIDMRGMFGTEYDTFTGIELFSNYAKRFIPCYHHISDFLMIIGNKSFLIELKKLEEIFHNMVKYSCIPYFI